MSESCVRDRHTVIACPVCAKNGNGRGAVQSYYHPNEAYCLCCVFCGWRGDYETCQSYLFPCKIYQVVEMDLSVAENLLNLAQQSEKRVEIELPYGTKTGDVLDYTIERSFNRVLLDQCGLEEALQYLATKGWLFPAIYKVEVDV